MSFIAAVEVGNIVIIDIGWSLGPRPRLEPGASSPGPKPAAMATQRVPPPPPFIDDGPPETVEFEACMIHSGRPPMQVQFSTRGRMRSSQDWFRHWEETPWHGHWRRQNEELEIAFRYFHPSPTLSTHIFNWKLDPHGRGYWGTKDDEVILTDMPIGFEQQLTSTRRSLLTQACEEALEPYELL